MVQSDPLRSLQRELIAGQINRRDFVRRALALGLFASAVGAALAACGTTTPTATPAPPSAAPTAAPAAAASASTGSAASAAPSAAASAASARPSAAASAASSAAASASAAPSAAAVAPTALPGPTKRGGGGALKLIQWQAPSILNPHLSSGTKDDLACAIMYEGLLRIDQEGNFLPFLAEAIPTLQTGLAADGKSVSWKLKAGLKWSDGTPLTAADCVTTWEYVVDPKTAATTVALFENVSKVEAIDDMTVKYTFTEPKPDWYRPAQAQILPKHLFEKDKGEPARTSQNNLKPVGTGPYKVTSFAPGDSVSYAINENYREATKPAFDTIELKGGGDAQSAARSVLQTGDFDYAWNLQIEDTIIKQLETGGKGVAEFYNGGGIERNLLNFTDPNVETNGERSSLASKHPFLTDIKVRQALALASDRKTVVDTLYGRGGAIGINFLEDPPIYRSKNTTFEFSLDKANALLEEAGWKKGSDGVREKGGVKLNVVYLSTINSVRQKTQQIVKDGWEKVGVKTEIKAVDSTIFFSSDVGNPDTSGKMYVDVQMYTTSAAFDPAAHMKRWTTTNAKLSQKEGKWSGGNDGRYVNPEYDKLWDAAKTELDANKRAQLFIQMNDILVNDYVMISLVNRKTAFARSTALKNANYSQWAGNYWNIANWMK